MDENRKGWRALLDAVKKRNAEERKRLPSHQRLSPEEAIASWNAKVERRKRKGLRWQTEATHSWQWGFHLLSRGKRRFTVIPFDSLDGDVSRSVVGYMREGEKRNWYGSLSKGLAWGPKGDDFVDMQEQTDWTRNAGTSIGDAGSEKTKSTRYVKTERKGSYPFTKTQRVLLQLLRNSGVGEDALVGTFLLLKDSEEEMEEMCLYLYDNKPLPEEITNYLIAMVRRRNRE